MAATRTLEILSGDSSNTEDTIYFKFQAKTTIEGVGKYYIRYQVGSGNKITTDTFSLVADTAYTTWEFEESDLEPGTSYTINATLYVAANNTDVAWAQKSVSTKRATTYTYYGCVRLDGNGGTYDNGVKVIDYTGRGTSTSSSGMWLDIDYSDPGFTRSGYTLAGFCPSASGSDDIWPLRESYPLKATSTSSSSPTLVTLYAVWTQTMPSTWSWNSQVGGTLSTTKIGENLYAVYPLTATEWNNFLRRIEEWATYLNTTIWTSEFQAASATKNTEMLASQATAAVNLLQALNPPTAPPAAPSTSGMITAAFVNGLAASLNSLRTRS